MSIVDSVTGQHWGAEAPSPGPPYQVPSHRNKIEPRFNVTYVTGSHAFKGGFDVVHDWGQISTNVQPGNMSWTYANGVPTTVTEWATPYSVREQNVADLGAFGQDQWTLKKLTLNYGLRWDYVRINVPVQTIGGTQFTPGLVEHARVYVRPLPVGLQSAGERLVRRVRQRQDGDQGGVGRYNLARGGSIFNPASSIVTSASRQWTDSNGNYFPDCDLTNNALNGECGPQNNAKFGTLNVVTNAANDAQINYRKYNWQTTASLQQELLAGVSLNATYVRTQWYNFTVTNNLNVHRSSFDPFCIPVPIDARLPLSGQQLCGLYDVQPAFFSAQTTNNQVQRTSDVSSTPQTDVFNGVDVTINARLPHGAFVSGGTSTGREVFDNCFAATLPDVVPLAYSNFSNANTTLGNNSNSGNPSGFCHVQPPFQTQLKLQGSYPLPYDFQVSASFQSLPGIPILASYQAPNALTVPSLGRPCSGNVSSYNVTNIIAPLTQFEDRVNQLDVRVTRVFKFGTRRLQANLDIYNALNGSGLLSENYTYGPKWLTPGSILNGRLFKFGGQFSF